MHATFRVLMMLGLTLSCALPSSVAGQNAAMTKPTQAELARSAIVSALYTADAAQAQIVEIHREHRRWPTAEEAAQMKSSDDQIAYLRVGELGVITLTIQSPASLSGRLLVLTPMANRPGAVGWICHAVGIPKEHLPPNCFVA